METINKIAEELHEVLVLCNAAAGAYDQAADCTENGPLRSVFARYAFQYAEYVISLRAVFYKFRIGLNNDYANGVHHLQAAAIDTADKQALIKQCVKAEKRVLSKYKQVLRYLSPDCELYSLFLNQKSGIEENIAGLQMPDANFAVYRAVSSSRPAVNQS